MIWNGFSWFGIGSIGEP